MILGEGIRTAGSAATLDDLFRRAGVRHPDALALADPPHREAFAVGAPRTLTFAQADRAVCAFAARLRDLGLQTDAIVAMQLPNTVESIIAFLGVLRAGMIAAPLPLLWRHQDIVAALGPVGAKAIVTASRVGSYPHAQIAMRAAADLFSVRYVCSFGPDLPDGIVSLDEVFASHGADLAASHTRAGPAAAHIAAITFDLDGDGPAAIARSHIELVAGGLEAFLEVGAPADAPLLSTIPTSSFSGIALTMLPWLLSGGALHLHHGFEPDAFVSQCRALGDATVVLPAGATLALAEAGLLASERQTIVALWRAPERLAAAKSWPNVSVVVDAVSFGEIGFLAARRGSNGLPASIPHGVADQSGRAAGAPIVIETRRTDAGTLALRGRMVATQAFPPGSERGYGARSSSDAAGWVDTGFACRIGRDTRRLAITAPPAGNITVGGYSFRESQVEAAVSRGADAASVTIVALPDAALTQRLAGAAGDRAAMRDRLDKQGVNPLISGAFQRHGPQAA
jgi:AMP-binding enzyme